MSKLRALTKDKRRAMPDNGAGSDEHLLFRRGDIEAAAQTVHDRSDDHMPWLVASEIDDGMITVLLFVHVQGKGYCAGEPQPGDQESLYGWIGESTGYPWGPHCGGGALDEHRHLYLGEEDGGYLYYPDLAMLRAFLDAIEQVYKGAELR
jgi:hypothetical protein